MNKEEINGIRAIIYSVFMQIKYGKLERGWEVYDEFKLQLEELIKKNEVQMQFLCMEKSMATFTLLLFWPNFG